jgi:mycothiol synthase
MTTLNHLGPWAVGDASRVPGLTFRQGRDDDWPALADVVNRLRAADGIEVLETADGIAADLVPLALFRLERDVLVAEIDGEPIGFAVGMLSPRSTGLVLDLWGAVVPERRRLGLGTALHRITAARLAREAEQSPLPGRRWLCSFALEQEQGDVALLESEGFTRVRFGFEMRRPIAGPLPDHALPDGLVMRTVSPDQHRAILDADNEAFRDHWGHREMTDGDAVSRFRNPDTDTSLWCVAWDGEEVAGSVINMVFREENQRLGINRGWLDHVSVRRAWRGRGVAKALCAASFRVLRERGLDEAWLGVDAANPTGALQLYESLGFQVARRWHAFGRPIDGPARDGWRPEGDEPASD